MNTYRNNKKEKGQIVVILALVLVGLIAIVGLAIDLGYLFVSYSRLRRAVDGAALAATSHFRQGYTVENLQKAAKQFLELNDVSVAGAISVKIENCDTSPSDTELCTHPARKLIRVTVTQRVPLFFLSVVGLREIPITVFALSEAASVDLVLLIDKSPSMALGAAGQEVDPKSCNAASDADKKCHPFVEVKAAALELVNRLFLSPDGIQPGYDRVSVVSFARFPKVELELTDRKTLIVDALNNLKVYEGERACAWASEGAAADWVSSDPNDQVEQGPCRSYFGQRDGSGNLVLNSYSQPVPNHSNYDRMWCLGFENYDPRGCTPTNSGGGLRVAGNVLGGGYPANYVFTTSPRPEVRETALWVVVWLTDGATNAGFGADGQTVVTGGSNDQTLGDEDDVIADAFCPKYTWARPQAPGTDPDSDYRFCADLNARPTWDDLHASPVDPLVLAHRHPKDPGSTVFDDLKYDADDYARDMVDFVTNPDTDPVFPGQGALMFTIGLGPYITDSNLNKTNYERTQTLPAPGEALLKYAAEKGSGIFYPAPTSAQLTEIFRAIANKIATRLSR